MTVPSAVDREGGRPASPRWACLVAATAGLLFATLPSPTSAAATAWVGDGHATVRLVAASEGRDGTLEAGVEFRFAPGWHGYWRTPGDAGIPPTIDWGGTPDLASADLAWPAPSRLVVSDLQNAVLDGTALLPVRLAFRASTSADVPRSLKATVDYAACSNICVPYHADLALDLPTDSSGTSPEALLVAAARAAVPGNPAQAGLLVRSTEISGAGADRRLVVVLESPAAHLLHPDLFVEGHGDGLPPAPSVALSDGGATATLTVPLPVRAGRDEVGATPLGLTVVDGVRSAAFDGPRLSPALQRMEASPSIGDASALGGLLAASLSALVGGLVLNLMPCVLPVLALKLAGLAGQGALRRRERRIGFAATALGIVTSFLLLGVVLAGLKASGQAIGWGIQFQQPLFLGFMALLTAAFAANLFDWLHVGVPSRIADLSSCGPRRTWATPFLTGALTTLLATPCSAPFVGTAAGFALSRGPAEILAIFLCLGLGMALPYVAVALVPRIAGWMPRPGPWIVGLRRILGLCLLGTAAWLLVVLSALVGPAAAGSVAVATAALLAFLGWSAAAVPFGARGRPRAAAFALAIAAIAMAVLPPRVLMPPAGREASMFDPDAIAPVVARGGTVLVDVSATWCLTCKVNEIAALGRAEVRERFARSGTVVMRADWTRPDPGISRYLTSFDRYGIPLDVVYGPGRPSGEALPELLTPGMVLTALDRAEGRP